MTREITTVGVVGLGTMGVGIVEAMARSGVRVIALEVDETRLAVGRASVERSTARAVERGKLTESERQSLLGRITYAHEFGALAEVDLVIEAVPERLELKQQVFSEVAKVVKDDTILATNTSSLSVTRISVATPNAKRVVGMHFFNPVPVQKLVEVIRTVVTAQDVVDDVAAFAEKLGKTPVVVGDKAGFIANALLFGYLNHAVSMFEAKFATREGLDAAMMKGCGLPMGPLALLDLIGLDTAYEILDTMYKEGRDRLHAPSPILRQMIVAGWKGRKSGRGFYTYEAPGSSKVVADELTPASADATGGANLRPVQCVGVVGTGTMASGIIEVFAKAGYDVTFVGRSQETLDGVVAKMTKSLDKALARGKTTQEARDAALAKVSGTTALADLADVDLVVEAVVEDLSVKQQVFADLGEICKEGAILATTTSSLPVIECAASSGRPNDVIGLHFFNPAQVMQLVEIVTTVSTSPDVTATCLDLCAKLKKHPVVCSDKSGFIVNALLFPYLNDAVKMLEANYASADDIDTAMKLGCGYPLGPFELLDVVGLDVSLAIEKELYLESRAAGYAPAPLLEHLVTAGFLGRKTGRGFRSYA